MKFTKVFIQLFAAGLLISSTSCQEQYPDLGDGMFAEFVTSKDTIIIQLFYDKVPLTVANFVGLADGTHPMLPDSLKGKPYYDGTVFHRVIDNFMIQGGDPTATGSGSPGFKFGDEFDESLKHDKPGILSMANSGPATNGSQFFITEKPTPHLDNRHSVFGEVVKGFSVVDTISNVKVTPGSNKPLEDVKILKLNIIRQGMSAKGFDAVDTWNTELPLLEEKRLQKLEDAKQKAEEAKKIAEEKMEMAAKEMVPVLNIYKSKATQQTSGLLVYNITKGNGVKPKTGNTVKLNYEGYFTDGKLFGTNIKTVDEKCGTYDIRKEQQGAYSAMPMKIDPEAQMIPGFKEGVFDMSVGDKTFLYLPSYLAYGEKGRGPIQPNTDLMFIIEMLEIAE
ncbi:peptidyl-prolyl cis-trans isomerase [Formosa sp. Hel1_33_131]|jgi:cyclophilin family peptidyl-prolyl cis-trans isomerase/FKBP-type peptidyl-prolyl cis-trans isomerase|uniref:peptidylprolyl isomerase n=1 Tax=Formosa sp. Hel1_33_131 TaxID=1336794 RepID=UPI00084E18FC|nr:peptidylprolyl isomerase [Formosa sp. Hel1_33_131]AOR27232.1 peptidyl-prolyl cis-trans isomerase [Formosa sp. Hel1_33_131]